MFGRGELNEWTYSYILRVMSLKSGIEQEGGLYTNIIMRDGLWSLTISKLQTLLEYFRQVSKITELRM